MQDFVTTLYKAVVSYSSPLEGRISRQKMFRGPQILKIVTLRAKTVSCQEQEKSLFLVKIDSFFLNPERNAGRINTLGGPHVLDP
jgi:hypothetical protein